MLGSMSSSEPSPIRIAFIGAGGINYAHRVAFERHPERLQMVGVADPVLAAAEKIGSPFNAPLFTDPRAMLDALRGKVDAVLVTTPHYLHFSSACLALERGLPVLVEKPATCTLAELKQLQAMERKYSTFVQVGQMQRFGQEENWIKRWLNSNAFGDPRLFNLDIYQNIEGYISGKTDPWILDKNRAGGGVVISVAVHILDLLRYWFDDDFVEVTARGRFDAPMTNGAESACVAMITTRRRMLGTLNCSYTVARCPYSQRSLLFGTHGTLAQHLDKIGGGYAGPYFLSTSNGQPSPEWNMMYSGFEKVTDRMAAEPGYVAPLHAAEFVRQMLTFADGVCEGRALENSLARNFNTIALIDAIAKSMETGQTQTVETQPAEVIT